MRYLFIVQGEGRGHLTQALSLAQILRSKGHRVEKILVGSANGRLVPDFFVQQIHAPVASFESPRLIYNPKKHAVNIGATVFEMLRGIVKYLKSLRQIRAAVEAASVDVIVNFYEPLGGVYNFLVRPKIPMVCIGHQYLLLHDAFVFPKQSRAEILFLNFHTRITALGANRKLALSFRPMPDQPKNSLFVVPPLLRSEAKQGPALPPPRQTTILAYVTFAALANELIEWHAKHPEIVVNCFWDKKEAPEVMVHNPNLTFYRLNSALFLEKMKACTAVVSTAGFESVCEAMYWNKPVLMMPAHVEQACNAADATLAGAGISANTFDLDALLAYLPIHTDTRPAFKAWEAEAERRFLSHLVSALSGHHAAVHGQGVASQETIFVGAEP